MLIKESQLSSAASFTTKLDEATYLTQEESKMHLEEVPIVVKENGSNIVDLNYIRSLVNESNVTIFEAVSMLQKHNNIDSLLISVDETDAIIMGEAFNQNSMVIKPISTYNEDVVWCNILSEAYQNGDISFEMFCEGLLYPFDEATVEELRQKHMDRAKNQTIAYGQKLQQQANDLEKEYIDKYKRGEVDLNQHAINMKGVDTLRRSINDKVAEYGYKKGTRINKAADKLLDAKGREQTVEEPQAQPKPPTPPKQDIEDAEFTDKKAAGGAGTVNTPNVDVNAFADKPKSVIANKIAALRSIYSNFMNKASASTETGIKARLKQAAAKILGYIDKLMEYIQNKAG